MLSIEPAAALEAYGSYFVTYMDRLGYTNLLGCLGSNIAEFVSRCDDLHLHLGVAFPAMDAPAFRVDQVCDQIQNQSV